MYESAVKYVFSIYFLGSTIWFVQLFIIASMAN